MKTGIRVLVVLLLLFLMAAALVAVNAAEKTQPSLPGVIANAGNRLEAQMQRTIGQAQALLAGNLPGTTP